MERALITGITGFVGSHLAEYLIGNGIEVYGTVRWRSKTENIDHIKDKLNLIDCDIRDSHAVEEAIRESEPDYVFHLAAQSFVPTSWRSPADTIETNVIGTVHLLEAIRKARSEPLIQVAGSSEEYGMVYPNEVPIRETNPLRPISPYGVSKVAEDKLCYQYSRSYGMKVVLTRAFNHTGPRRGDVFVTSNFSKQIAEIETGSKEPVMRVGNLTAKRDFSDVRDVVKAYWLSLKRGEPGEVYNICSGTSRTIQSVLDILLEKSTRNDIRIEQDPARMRPSDVQILEGNCSKFSERTGWNPEIPFEKTVEDLLEYWRQAVQKK